METRTLTDAERYTLVAALSRQKAYVVDAMSTAADDQDVSKLRALLVDYDQCMALCALIAHPCGLVAIQ